MLAPTKALKHLAGMLVKRFEMRLRLTETIDREFKEKQRMMGVLKKKARHEEWLRRSMNRQRGLLASFKYALENFD